MPQLTAILDEVFGSQPMAHWYEVFSGVHVTFGAVRGPQEVIKDPQLRPNDIVVPLEGRGRQADVDDQQPDPGAWRRESAGQTRPEIGEHNEAVLEELGFDAAAIRPFRASGAIDGRIRSAKTVRRGKVCARTTTDELLDIYGHNH